MLPLLLSRLLPTYIYTHVHTRANEPKQLFFLFTGHTIVNQHSNIMFTNIFIDILSQQILTVQLASNYNETFLRILCFRITLKMYVCMYNIKCISILIIIFPLSSIVVPLIGPITQFSTTIPMYESNTKKNEQQQMRIIQFFFFLSLFY